MWWPENSWTKHDGRRYHQRGKEKELLACQRTALRNQTDNRVSKRRQRKVRSELLLTPVTSEIWTTRWICAVSQLALLHRCPPALSWLLSIKTRGWAEGTRHDRLECLIHAFSRGKTGRSFYTTVLFLFLLNKRQNIKSEQMCAPGWASQTVSISSYRRVEGLFYV